LRDIKKGEELSYDYGFGFDEDYKQFPCKCGSKNCCGYIVREGSRWRIKKKKK
jgi:SET domain-containing protein